MLIWSTHSLMNAWTVSIILAIVNKCTINMGVQISLQSIYLTSFGCMSRSGIGCWIICNSTFSFTSNFHTIFHSGYINTYSHQQYTSVPLSLHCGQHLNYLLWFHFCFKKTCVITIPATMWCLLWFAFSRWLVMLSTFLYTCCPLYVFFEKNVCKSFAHFFIKLDFGFCCCCIAIELYEFLVFWIVTPYHLHDSKIFSPNLQADFPVCWLLPLLCRGILVWYSPPCLFLFFVSFAWGDIFKKNIAKTDVKEHFAHVFF